MRAETAASYVDEKSVEAFRRRAGTIYPRPISIRGRGEVWIRETLDQAIDRLDELPGAPTRLNDIADLV